MRRSPERATSIPSEPWEDISLAKYFVVVILLLLGSMAWALYNEVYTRRPWKSFQREFFALAQRKYEKDLAEAKKALASDEYKQLRQAFNDAVSRYEKNPEVIAARKEIERIDKQLTEVRKAFQLARGDYQATIYVMERTADPGAKRRLQQEVDRMEPEVMKLLGEMESLQQKKKEQQDKLTALAQEKMDAEKKMSAFETRLRDAELGLEALKKERVKIRQVFNDDLKIVDRCQSCHVAVDRKGFDKFKQPFRSHPDVFFLPVEEEKSNGEATKVATPNGETPEPPRLKNLLAVHETEKFGCSLCHGGQGFAASSGKDAHGEVEFVLTPLRRGALVQSSCVKCHKQETELLGAPILNEGRRLVVEYGCIGCHTFAQLTPEETNRQVAPDLKEIRKKLISPQWLVNWIEQPKKFRPTTKMPHFGLTREQAVQIASYLWQNAEKPSQHAPPAATFPATQIRAGEVLVENVGCFACHAMYDKKGESNFAPHLGRIGEKLRYDYLVSWLMDPKQHQPQGRMPRLRLTRQEASNIAAYLTTKRMNRTNRTDRTNRTNNLDDPKAAAEGKLLIEHYGCSGCHPIKGMETRGKIGAELSQFGSKPVEQLDYGLLEKEVLHRVHLHHVRDNVLQARVAWAQQKLRDPRSYDRGRYRKFKDKLRMPNFGFNEKQIEAIVTFLMGLTDEKIPAEWQSRLDERQEAVAKGLRIIRRQNCIGCHQLKLETLTFARDNGKTYHLEGATKIEEQGTIFFQLWKDLPALGRKANEMQPVSDPEHPTDKILSRTPGWGGDIVPLLIDQWVKKARLAPEEARTYAPPMLIGEGRKVQPPWLFDFLKEPVILRPWLQVRMPTFDLSDEDAAAVVRYFAAVDGGTFPYRRVLEREPAYIAAKRQADPTYYARALRMMTSEDIKCFSCHVRGSQKPEGNPSDWAPDLSLAQRRLQPEWIVAWLKNPSGLYPGTKMPQFPFGEFQHLFPGSAEQQMTAIKDLIMSGQLSAPMVASAKR
jgi:cbb3-type cytochrome oxidase cytochrome c subunit